MKALVVLTWIYFHLSKSGLIPPKGEGREEEGRECNKSTSKITPKIGLIPNCDVFSGELYSERIKALAFLQKVSLAQPADFKASQSLISSTHMPTAHTSQSFFPRQPLFDLLCPFSQPDTSLLAILCSSAPLHHPPHPGTISLLLSLPRCKALLLFCTTSS